MDDEDEDDDVICSERRWKKTWRGGGLSWKEEEPDRIRVCD